jgi:outer membrane biosynthesis protein TonB
MMKRPVLIVLFSAAACAASQAPRATQREDVEACASHAQPSVAAATVQRLERATNVLEYESIWREAHPGTRIGSVGRTELRSRISSHGEQIRSCYEAALRQLPDGRGRVVVRFVIDQAGSVPFVNVSGSEPHSPQLSCCIAKRVASWSFAKPSDGDYVVVEYPFTVKVSQTN